MGNKRIVIVHQNIDIANRIAMRQMMLDPEARIDIYTTKEAIEDDLSCRWDKLFITDKEDWKDLVAKIKSYEIEKIREL